MEFFSAAVPVAFQMLLSTCSSFFFRVFVETCFCGFPCAEMLYLYYDFNWNLIKMNEIWTIASARCDFISSTKLALSQHLCIIVWETGESLPVAYDLWVSYIENSRRWQINLNKQNDSISHWIWQTTKKNSTHCKFNCKSCDNECVYVEETKRCCRRLYF